MKEGHKQDRKKLWMFLLVGIFIGIVIFAGTSSTLSATDTGEFCSSCHVMDLQYDSYVDSSHANLTCNDCHAPTDSTVSKLMYKAKSGASHVYANTVGASNLPDVFHASTSSQDVVNANCISCHETTLENVDHEAKDSCIDCHRNVPHNKGDFRPDEWYEPREFDFAR